MRQFCVFSGDAAGIVGGEIDTDPVVDVEPFRVMIHFLNAHSGDGHEADGVGEIGELKLAMEFGVFDGPTGQILQNGLEFSVAELVKCHEVILAEKREGEASVRSVRYWRV
jgi:hypothetical protein